MKARIISLILAFALLIVPALSLGEETSTEFLDIRLVVNGEAVVPVDSQGNRVQLVVVNGILYVPLGTIPSALGLPYTYDEASNTIYIGEQEIHGLCWVLKGTDYTVEESGHDGRETYAYEGVTDGMARFTRSGGYSDDSKWGVCDGTYECEVPPEVIWPGETLSLAMKIAIENYSWKGGSSSDINSVHVGTLYVCLNGMNFEDADGNKELYIGTAAGRPYAGGDLIREGVFSMKMSESQTEGATAEILFHCQSGTVVWKYELVNKLCGKHKIKGRGLQ